MESKINFSRLEHYIDKYGLSCVLQRDLPRKKAQTIATIINSLLDKYEKLDYKPLQNLITYKDVFRNCCTFLETPDLIKLRRCNKKWKEYSEDKLSWSTTSYVIDNSEELELNYKTLPFISSLELYSDNYYNLYLLMEFKSLRSLSCKDFKNCYITRLATLNLPHLQELTLEKEEVNREPITFGYSFLFPSLTKLTLKKLYLFSLDFLAEIKDTLTTLNIQETVIGHKKEIHYLNQLTKVTKLELHELSFSSEDNKKTKKRKNEWLEGNSNNNKFIFNNLTSLTYLDLGYDEPLINLFTLSFTNSVLNQLALRSSDCKENEEIINVWNSTKWNFLKEPCFASLQYLILEISGEKLNEELFTWLHGLKEVYLYYTQFLDNSRACSLLCESNSETLEVLDFRSNSDLFLGGIEKCKKLNKLVLSQRDITEQELIIITRCASLKNLSLLNLNVYMRKKYVYLLPLQEQLQSLVYWNKKLDPEDAQFLKTEFEDIAIQDEEEWEAYKNDDEEDIQYSSGEDEDEEDDLGGYTEEEEEEEEGMEDNEY